MAREGRAAWIPSSSLVPCFASSGWSGGFIDEDSTPARPGADVCGTCRPGRRHGDLRDLASRGERHDGRGLVPAHRPWVAAASPRWVAIVTSIAAVFMLNFFFLPPIGALTIADPQNWIALFAFLSVSLVAGRLAALARGRHHEAVSRRDELARLFNLSRDILLTTEADAEAIACLARHLAARFELDYVSICLPGETDFERFEAGVLDLSDLVPTEALRRALREADRASECAPDSQVLTGRQVARGDGGPPVRLAPLRLGTRAIGVLATAGRPIEPGIFDTLGSVVAIAIERIHFLEERRRAELARRSAEFKSALLASLAHDLRTPLTAIRVAAQQSPCVMADRAPARRASRSRVDRGRAADAIVPKHPRDDADRGGRRDSTEPLGRSVRDRGSGPEPDRTVVLGAPDRRAPSIGRSRRAHRPASDIRGARPSPGKRRAIFTRGIGDHGGA